MKKTKKRKKTKKKIIQLLKQENNILFAYLYGSYARKEENQKSDIDIAIYLSQEPKTEFLPEKLSTKLEKKINKNIDIRILNNRKIIFKHQVLKHSELLFSKDENKRVEFETYVYDRYLDFKYYINQYNQKRREEILTWSTKN